MSNDIDQEEVEMELQTEDQTEGQVEGQAGGGPAYDPERGYQVLPPSKYSLEDDMKGFPDVEFVEIRTQDEPLPDEQPWTARYLLLNENDEPVRIVLLDAVFDGPRILEEEDQESETVLLRMKYEKKRQLTRLFVPAPKNKDDWNYRMQKRVFKGNTAELPAFEKLAIGGEDTNIGWCVRAIASDIAYQATEDADASATTNSTKPGRSSKRANGSADGDQGPQYPNGWIVNLTFYKDREAANAHVGVALKLDKPSDNKDGKGDSGQDEPEGR